MNAQVKPQAIIIDMSPHYVEGVPWLLGRPNGERLSKLSLAENGPKNIEGGTMFRMIIPNEKGVNKSFFEGFLLDFSKRTLEKNRSLLLSELVSIDPETPEGANERYNQTKKNFDAALLSLTDFWNNQDVSTIQLVEA